MCSRPRGSFYTLPAREQRAYTPKELYHTGGIGDESAAETLVGGSAMET